MASKVLKPQNVMATGPLGTAFRKWYYGLEGSNKLGLYSDDLLDASADVQEALKRLEPEQFHDRQFRLSRAVYLETLRKILPEDEWISYEDNEKNGSYLQKHLSQVLFEKEEREAWDAGRVTLKYKF